MIDNILADKCKKVANEFSDLFISDKEKALAKWKNDIKSNKYSFAE